MLCQYLPPPLRLLCFSGSLGLRRSCWSKLSAFARVLKMKSCFQSPILLSQGDTAEPRRGSKMAGAVSVGSCYWMGDLYLHLMKCEKCWLMLKESWLIFFLDEFMNPPCWPIPGGFLTFTTGSAFPLLWYLHVETFLLSRISCQVLHCNRLFWFT